MQFDAKEVKTPPQPPSNSATVDADVISEANIWSPVHRITRDHPAGHFSEFSSFLGDGLDSSPKNGKLKLLCGMNNGQNGYFPEGRMLVRVVFHTNGKFDSPAIAEADIILVVPPPL